MSDVTVRKAELEDKDAVMRIRDFVYGGRDYLILYYDTFIKSENCYPYVAAIDGKIVGYCAAFMVDDMKTLIPRCARVSPDYTGKGIYRTLMETIMSDSRKIGVINYSFTSDGGNPAIFKESFRKQNRFVLQKEGLCYTFSGYPGTDNTLSAGMSRVPEATDSDIKTYMTSKDYVKYLFRSDVLIVNWVPYRMLKSNIDIIRKVDKSMIFSDVRMCRGKPKGMVSIGTIVQCTPDIYGYDIELYGQDSSTFKQHLIQHIEYLTSKAKENISLNIIVDLQLDVNVIKLATEDIGLIKTSWVDKEDGNTRFHDELYLFESDM